MYCPRFISERLGRHMCNARRQTSELQSDFAHWDFTLLQHEHDALFFECNEREPPDALAQRGRTLLQYLSSRSETNIAVISHSSFLICLFRSCLDVQNDLSLVAHLDTGEMRSMLLDFSPLQQQVLLVRPHSALSCVAAAHG